jgi:hypothetical protein
VTDEEQAALLARVEALEKQQEILGKVLLNLRGLINSRNVRGSTAKLLAATAPLGSWTWRCPIRNDDSDCGGRKPFPAPPDELCDCYEQRKASAAEHSARERMNTPKPKEYKKSSWGGMK